jgi:hypothetical protein
MPWLTRRAPLALLIAASVACGGGDSTASNAVRVDTLPGGIPRTTTAAPIEAGRWALVAERDVAPAEDSDGELLQPSDIALADDGSLVVFEDSPAHIKVFDPSGALARTIGREGAGPGEYRAGYITLVGDTLVVQDPSNSRATFVAWRTGERLGEKRTACCYYSGIGADSEQRVWVRSISAAPDTTLPHSQSFFRFGLTGERVDTVYAYERAGLPESKPWLVREGNMVRMAMSVPMQPQAHWVVDRAGALLTAWSGEYSIRSTRDGRDTVAVFGRPWTAEPVTDGEKGELVEGTIRRLRLSNPNGPGESTLRASFDPALIPSTRPAFESIDVDGEGRRWVRLNSADTTRVRYDLFDVAGRWLDSVGVPAEDWTRQAWTPASWSRTHVAVLLEGEDGRPLIRIFAIRGP